jgi:hypothetical protein
MSRLQCYDAFVKATNDLLSVEEVSNRSNFYFYDRYSFSTQPNPTRTLLAVIMDKVCVIFDDKINCPEERDDKEAVLDTLLLLFAASTAV